MLGIWSPSHPSPNSSHSSGIASTVDGPNLHAIPPDPSGPRLSLISIGPREVAITPTRSLSSGSPSPASPSGSSERASTSIQSFWSRTNLRCRASTGPSSARWSSGKALRSRYPAASSYLPARAAIRYPITAPRGVSRRGAYEPSLATDSLASAAAAFGESAGAAVVAAGEDPAGEAGVAAAGADGAGGGAPVAPDCCAAFLRAVCPGAALMGPAGIMARASARAGRRRVRLGRLWRISLMIGSLPWGRSA